MVRGWKVTRRAGLMALVLAMASCVDAERVGGPSASVLSATGASYDLLEGFFPNPLGNGASCSVTGPDGGGRLQSAATIGVLGGTVTITGGVVNGRVIAHVLTVPPLAVTSNTRFCMKLDPANHMQVHLQAHRLSNGNVVNVGAAGFRTPVLLTLTYASLNLPANLASKVVVLYDPETGAPLEQTNSVSVVGLSVVTASLDHFSKYAMAMD